MSNERTKRLSKYDNWSANKSDEWLAKVLQGEDQHDIDLAIRILKDRYQAEFNRYVSRKLPADWVDDVTQQIWIDFYNKVKVEGIREKVSHFLRVIAKRRRVDAVRKRAAERRIEADIPINWGDNITGREIETLEEPFQEQLEKQIQQRFVRQIPFNMSLLSDCERVLWMLREQLEISSPMVARLTDKKSRTVHSSLYYARKKVKQYLESKDFDLWVACQELQDTVPDPIIPDNALIVEQFSNCISPQFTPDELKPLGLAQNEFRDHYIASIILPWEPDNSEYLGHLAVLLTRRSEWDDFQTMLEHVYHDRNNPDYLSPEECLISIDVVERDFNLTLEQVLELLPEPQEWQGSSMSDNTYLSVHNPRMRVPVTFGFFDSGLYDEALRERWPFLPEDAGL